MIYVSVRQPVRLSAAPPWVSNSTEAEIYTTDECVKILHHISSILEEIDLKEEFMSAPIDIYNDNQSSINWAHSMTTKGLRHLQIRENAVREEVQTNFARVKHVSGKVNLSDILTKEDKYKSHYITPQDRLISNLEIISNVRRCIHICEIFCVVPAYGDSCHGNSPPSHISNVDFTYNDLCICLSTGPSVRHTSLGPK